ncbi:MAG: hypothetical protein A2203_08035 [Chromatiales bacterium RIFOXYA1_FULL_46_5]|nr:MAG: hypothetical protein A2203_08035 [Chromatiales bacterium RIFOXYA1_FULL_46_5]
MLKDSILFEFFLISVLRFAICSAEIVTDAFQHVVFSGLIRYNFTFKVNRINSKLASQSHYFLFRTQV